MNSPAHSPALESALERRRIRLRGLVQGVGFRPHVYRCAARLGITGSVHNGPEGVVIEAQGVRLDDFVQLLQREAPPLARAAAPLGHSPRGATRLAPSAQHAP